ncbi:MAG: hypothetical protein RML37_07715 [Chitinophagales bacterium]|nr:hypothetical protein [Chitinophagales bacterium]
MVKIYHKLVWQFAPGVMWLALCGCHSTGYLFHERDPRVSEKITRALAVHRFIPDDPAEYDVVWQHRPARRKIIISKPHWVVPSANLPRSLPLGRSNNNVSIAIHNHKLYLAFRTGRTHFASRKSGLYVISTCDGHKWDKELSIFPGHDVREPFLAVINDTLHLYYFEAGKNPFAFQPRHVKCVVMEDDGKWSTPTEVLSPGEVPWSMKKRRGAVYLSSYAGSHYRLRGKHPVKLYFKKTKNGKHFTAAACRDEVYTGGVSEADFEFDREGNLWAVGRLEDGDQTGFGTQIFFASKDNLCHWQYNDTAEPHCYMSPRLFRQGEDIYLIGRKHLGRKPFARTARHKPMARQRLRNWIGYSLSPKTTALYRINRQTRRAEWIMDLPGAGDNCFPSLVRLDENRLLLANYSSPLMHRKRTWLGGQLRRTGIYLLLIEFLDE